MLQEAGMVRKFIFDVKGVNSYNILNLYVLNSKFECVCTRKVKNFTFYLASANT